MEILEITSQLIEIYERIQEVGHDIEHRHDRGVFKVEPSALTGLGKKTQVKATTGNGKIRVERLGLPLYDKDEVYQHLISIKKIPAFPSRNDMPTWGINVSPDVFYFPDGNDANVYHRLTATRAHASDSTLHQVVFLDGNIICIRGNGKVQNR